MKFKIGQIVKIKKLDEKYLERHVGISYNLYLKLMTSDKLYISNIGCHNDTYSYEVSGNPDLVSIWFNPEEIHLCRKDKLKRLLDK